MAENLAPITAPLDVPTKAYVDAAALAATEVAVSATQPSPARLLWVDTSA